jgi:hypothetical protein
VILLGNYLPRPARGSLSRGIDSLSRVEQNPLLTALRVSRRLKLLREDEVTLASLPDEMFLDTAHGLVVHLCGVGVSKHTTAQSDQIISHHDTPVPGGPGGIAQQVILAGKEFKPTV